MITVNRPRAPQGGREGLGGGACVDDQGVALVEQIRRRPCDARLGVRVLRQPLTERRLDPGPPKFGFAMHTTEKLACVQLRQVAANRLTRNSKPLSDFVDPELLVLPCEDKNRFTPLFPIHSPETCLVWWTWRRWRAINGSPCRRILRQVLMTERSHAAQ